MAPNKSSSKVVRSWTTSECPTGEYLCQDNTGRVWRVGPPGSGTQVRAPVTGETQGILDRGRITVLP